MMFGLEKKSHTFDINSFLLQHLNMKYMVPHETIYPHIRTYQHILKSLVRRGRIRPT